MDEKLGNMWLSTAEMYMKSGYLISIDDEVADYVGKFYNIKFESIDGDKKKYLIVSKK